MSTGVYYLTETEAGLIYDVEKDSCLTIKEARERITELEACIDLLNIAAGPDPMDIYKASLEAL